VLSTQCDACCNPEHASPAFSLNSVSLTLLNHHHAVMLQQSGGRGSQGRAELTSGHPVMPAHALAVCRVMTTLRQTQTCMRSQPCHCSLGTRPQPVLRQQRQQQQQHLSSSRGRWTQSAKGLLLVLAVMKGKVARAASQRRSENDSRKGPRSKVSCRPLNLSQSPFGHLSSSTHTAGCRDWVWT
jgi:hypothetical protein